MYSKLEFTFLFELIHLFSFR